MCKFDITEELLGAVSSILYHHDPAGLAKLGVPEDEYDSEAYLILEEISDKRQPKSSSKLIYDVFEHSFSKVHILEFDDIRTKKLRGQVNVIVSIFLL